MDHIVSRHGPILVNTVPLTLVQPDSVTLDLERGTSNDKVRVYLKVKLSRVALEIIFLVSEH